ncbi:MAG: hypothetical protein QNI87_05170 [Erythrobacter sp.]|uniref:hypothetical protein n=1 Tax=Erythrobacter sp. TaxID=1042 RepID=UPI002608F95B|nr:hypothetical protein [Erythrobacter sp.]MDJ0977908.1 hypothetical protein [Erythrobacter sp.]
MQKRLHTRLSSYWKLEVANAALIPAIMVFLCLYTGQAVSLWLALACVPMCGLLILGGLYWRAKLHQLEGRAVPLERVLKQAHTWRLPLLATTALACVLAVGVRFTDLAASSGERWAITVAAVLAALEYINYYHRQLQHFDNWPDFKRLVTGRGFPVSQMAKDMKRQSR